MPGLLSRAKKLIVRSGKRARTIKSGAFQGLRMDLDLGYECQTWLGLAEREIHGWLGRLSAGIGTGIDIGAAAGEYALYFLAKTSARKVLAFEPQTLLRDQLRHNLALNALEDSPRLTLVSSYVSSTNERDHCTLESFSNSIVQPCLVKIDVDGGEGEVLAGARELLKQRETRWIIETHSRELEEQCRSVLETTGFATVIVPNAWWRWLVPEQRPIPHNRWLVGFRSLDSLIPRGKTTSQRTRPAAGCVVVR